jgi:hypothetical protein
VSLVVDVVVVAGGIALVRWVLRRARRNAPVRAEAAGREGASDAPRASELLAGFPCKLGDVVLRSAERDEAWLAGALVFLEDRPVAALFSAPEAGGDRALFVRAAPGAGITWLAPLAPGVLDVPKEPPHALELDGVRFERARRLPVDVKRVGSGAPPVGARAVVAEYTGPANQRLLVVAGADATLAWKGASLGDGEYDVLPGGGGEDGE